jgi:hypothetical protein
MPCEQGDPRARPEHPRAQTHLWMEPGLRQPGPARCRTGSLGLFAMARRAQRDGCCHRPALELKMLTECADEQQHFHRYWEAWGALPATRSHRLTLRSTVAPLANSIEALSDQRREVTLTVVGPEIVVRRRCQRPLHRHIGPHLRGTLCRHAGIAICAVRMPTASRLDLDRAPVIRSSIPSYWI